MFKNTILLLASLLSISTLVLTLTGCGGGSSSSPDASIPYPITIPAYYVNSATGNDSNSGTLAAPFKTVTKAINAASAVAATSGAAIFVAPGVYDAANGEVFPLMPTLGEQLIGDVPNKGLGTTATTISGAASYTITGGAYAVGGWNTTLVISSGVVATVTGFDIAGAVNGILVDSGMGMINYNTIKNQTIGAGNGGGNGSDSLTVLNGGFALATANDIRTTGWCGICIHDSTSFATIRNSTINSLSPNAGDAVWVTTDASLDLGTIASPGNNIIVPDSPNSVGLHIDSTGLPSGFSGTVMAVGNTWQPNVQGADSAGHYPDAYVFAAGTAYVGGNNYANPGTVPLP